MDHTPGCRSLCLCTFSTFLFSPSHFQCDCRLFFWYSQAVECYGVDIVQLKNIRCAPLPLLPHPKCTWPALFICMRMFSLRCYHQAIWMGYLHSDSPVTEYDWGQAGLSRSAGVYVIVCVVEQHDLLVQCEGFTLLQVCVLSLMRLICHRCLRGCMCVCVCVCVCVFVLTYLRMVIYAIGLEQKRPFLISSRNRQEVLYCKCVCVWVSVCVCVCVCLARGF